MSESTEQILSDYSKSIQNYREALRLSGLTEAMVQLVTSPTPDFNRMLPTDVVDYFNTMKEKIILHFHHIGLSTREISRRIGGSSSPHIGKIIAKHEKPETTATFDEVRILQD